LKKATAFSEGVGVEAKPREHAMARSKMDVLDTVRKAMESDGSDWLRCGVEALLNELMAQEAQAQTGAGYEERSPERTNSRNGYRERGLQTRVGTLALQVPKLRRGSYFPSFLEAHKRSEEALIAAVAQAYVSGVSTRNMEALVAHLGVQAMSASQVSELCKRLDATVEDFRNRPLRRSYPYVWMDALVMKGREGGRVVNAACLLAVGVTNEGQREVLGLEVVTQETGADWLQFLRSLKARGLSGVKLLISDAHAGLQEAIAAAMPGCSWQRCRTHMMRNILSQVPRHQQPVVATVVRSIFAQPDRTTVEQQFEQVVSQLQRTYPKVALMLTKAKEDILAFRYFDKAHWKQIWSNNPQERLNKEIRRRTDAVGVFPNRESLIRLVGSILCDQNEEWAVVRRYMTFAGPEEQQHQEGQAQLQTAA
jgi:putative transposase